MKRVTTSSRSLVFAPLLLMAMGMLLAALGGCMSEPRRVSSTWDPFREKLADPGAAPRDAGANDPRVVSPRGYAVELARFSGPDAPARAFELTARLRAQAGLAELWSADGPNLSTVYLGRFRDPRSDTARLAIKQAREAELDGMTLFANAEMVPLSGGNTASLPELDLRNHTGQYALQIGYFDLGYGTAFRKAAEDRAQELRDQGHDAYYYHGPNRSLIAIGPYTYEQAFIRVGQTDTYAATVLATQRQFPYNVRNDVGPNDEFTPEELGLQPSFLVLVR